MNKVFTIILSVLLFIPALIKAQDDDISSLNKDIIFRKEGRIELPSVTRNYEKITFDPPKGEIKPQTYDFAVIPAEVAKLDMKIKVRTLNPDDLKKLYGSYIKAGFGNYVTPYLEGHFASKRSDEHIYGLHVRHLSSSRGPVDYARTSENIISGYGTYFMDNLAIDGRLHYQRNRYNYYGFNQEQISIVDTDSLKQVYHVFSPQVTFRNIDHKDQINYKIGLKYWLFNSRFNTENEFAGDFRSNYWIDKDKEAEVEGIYSYSQKSGYGDYSRHFFQIKPAIVLSSEKYKVKGGLNIAYTSDTVDMRKFHIYPRVEADYYLVEDELTAFAGIDGEMQRNLLRTFAEENPWIGADVPLANTNKTFEVYGGLKGNVLERLNYKVRLAYQNYRYLPFFVNSEADSSLFTVLYETGNSTVLNILGAASYDFTEKLRIGVNANYNSYNLSTIEEPWHRPNFDLSVLTTYNIYKKIYFNVDIFYLSGIRAKNFNTESTEKLPDILDLNARIDYKFSDAFSAFIQANNIISKRYQRYLYYPVRGINVLAGISYTF